MGKLSEIRQRSNEFIANLSLYLAMAVENSEDELMKLNRTQMLNSKLSDGNPILPKYSPAYARKKGFSSPNLKVTGEFQADMAVDVQENSGQYFLTSFDYKTPFLVAKYGSKIFGISPQSKPKAMRRAHAELNKLYKQKVIR